MKQKKLYTTKQWRKFKKIHVKEINGIKNYFDVQEIMCKKYDVILTDYKTKQEKIISVLKKINFKNFDHGMDTFNNMMNDFGKSMSELSKEFESSEKNKTSNVKIWPDFSKKEVHRNDEINLEKIWGKKK